MGRSCSRPRTCSAPAPSRSAAWRPSSPRWATRLQQRRRRGVSAGNHGQALAAAAAQLGIPCEVFVPADAPMAKVEAARGPARPSTSAATASTPAWSRRSSARETGGLAFVHPFDDPAIVAGQGSLGLELLEDVPDLAQGRHPGRRRRPVRGRRAGDQGRPARRPDRRRPGGRLRAVPGLDRRPASRSRPTRALTIADGIAVKRPGGITLPLLTELDRRDRRRGGGRDRRGDGAPARALQARRRGRGSGRRRRAARRAGQARRARRHGRDPQRRQRRRRPAGRDRPPPRERVRPPARRCSPASPTGRAALARILATVADTGANIVDVSHMREGLDLHVRETAVEMVLETRGHEHAQRVLGDAQRRGVRRPGPALSVHPAE